MKEVDIMRMAKDETVYPKDGRRKNPLRRWITEKSDKAITAGSQKEGCNPCQHATS